MQAYDVPRVPIREGDAVLDIGANQGFFTCYAAHRGARVYAFEPNPESYETLLSNVERNGFVDRVEAKPWAITDKQGIGELIVSNELGGGMSTINPEFARNARITARKALEVPLDTLAHVLDVLALPRLRLCKVDAEGSEIEVLRTLRPRHLAAVDSFALEIHPEAYSLQDLMALVLEWGTHQIGFKDESRFSPVIVRLISNRVLSDGAGVR
ncbi:MAG TPA: FkbM family methyltransferase [Candidatus Acidoferrales bacterium]|nr:FkbM family methyltransferase [Candidatus Acidoferrales bacterium]